MTKLKVLSPIIHDGKTYKPGQKFEGDDKVVADLIAAGALEDPNRPKTEDEADELANAKVQADELIKAAEQHVADAKVEADKLRDDAKVDAEKIRADAKVEADKLVKDAQDPTKKAAEAKPSTSTK
jgi:dsDNA-specific endonuclease/ATPase MutS2